MCWRPCVGLHWRVWLIIRRLFIHPKEIVLKDSNNISYKPFTTGHRCIDNTGHPVYLSELIQKRVAVRSLRSFSKLECSAGSSCANQAWCPCIRFRSPLGLKYSSKECTWLQFHKTLQESTEDVLVWSLGWCSQLRSHWWPVVCWNCTELLAAFLRHNN